MNEGQLRFGGAVVRVLAAIEVVATPALPQTQNHD